MERKFSQLGSLSSFSALNINCPMCSKHNRPTTLMPSCIVANDTCSNKEIELCFSISACITSFYRPSKISCWISNICLQIFLLLKNEDMISYLLEVIIHWKYSCVLFTVPSIKFLIPSMRKLFTTQAKILLG